MADEELNEDQNPDPENPEEETLEPDETPELQNMQSANYLPPLVWHSPTHRHTEKGVDWYIALAVITLSITVTSIIFSNYILAALILIAGFALSLNASRPPRDVTVGIDDSGVAIHDEFYPFSALEAFWIDEEDTDVEDPLLLIKSDRALAPLTSIWINTEDVDPQDVRDQLAAFLEEEEMHEPITQRLMEWVGF